MAGARKSMNVSVEDQHHGGAEVVAQMPRVAIRGKKIEVRCGLPNRRPYEGPQSFVDAHIVTVVGSYRCTLIPY